MRLSVVIPTCGRASVLARALDRLGAQAPEPPPFEVLVVADAREPDRAAVDRAAEGRPFPVLRLDAERPGASAARNAGWRAASAPLVLFLGDDVLASPGLLAAHLARHERAPNPEVGVLGHVRWADGLRVTPFMRWLERGLQFDFEGIAGEDAGWGRFYTANASVKRAALEAVGGFDEEAFPYLYEDLDLARRMHDALGFRLLYAREADAEHEHAATVDDWRERMALVAAAERRFVERHPDVQPHFRRLLAGAAAAPPARGRGARLARLVPRGTPWLGPRVWASAEAAWLAALAPAFLAAWEAAGQADDPGAAPAGAQPSGSIPGGPK